MTQPGETGGMSAVDHVRAVLEHAGPVVDVALLNSAPLGGQRVERYARAGAEPVRPTSSASGPSGWCRWTPTSSGPVRGSATMPGSSGRRCSRCSPVRAERAGRRRGDRPPGEGWTAAPRVHTSRGMAKARPYVPAQPTLGWAQLRAADRPLAEHPFSALSVSWTHLGRSALHLAARVLGLEGREVLVPAYHQGIEVDALLAAGAHPTFYDVGPRWGVDLEDLEGRIGHRTGGLVLTHFAGFPGPASQLRALADRHGLVLIEDCAQALLSTDGEVPVGTTGDAAVFSFRKTLPVPHGGALVFNGPRGFQLPPRPEPCGRSDGAGPPRAGAAPGRVSSPEPGRSAPAPRGVARPALRVSSVARQRHSRGAWVRPAAARAGRFAPGRARGACPAALASVVERRRRNFFHLLGALRGAARRWSTSFRRGCARCSTRSGSRTRTRCWPGSARRTSRPGRGGGAFHSRCDGGEFPEASRLRRHVLELPCHQDSAGPRGARGEGDAPGAQSRSELAVAGGGRLTRGRAGRAAHQGTADDVGEKDAAGAGCPGVHPRCQEHDLGGLGDPLVEEPRADGDRGSLDRRDGPRPPRAPRSPRGRRAAGQGGRGRARPAARSRLLSRQRPRGR